MEEQERKDHNPSQPASSVTTRPNPEATGTEPAVGNRGDKQKEHGGPANPSPHATARNIHARKKEEEGEQEEHDSHPEGFPTATVAVPTGEMLTECRRKMSASSDDDVSLLSSQIEQFEDEPDKGFPKPSPNRLAARASRRKFARKQKNIVSGGKHSSLSKVGLAGLRPFAKEKRVKGDDESSHWSSSDGEYSEGNDRRDHAWLSQDDIEICQRLDEEYERALEEREVVYTARYNSVRQSACFSVFFMLLYLSLGTVFFMRQANWTLSESVLFSIYTITTVGCKFLLASYFL